MRSLIISAVFAVLLALPGSAGPIEDSIVRQLRDQGFSQIDVRRTLLGRSRIVAQSPTFYREIVVNPVTGEILRDFSRRLDDQRGDAPIFGPGGAAGGSGNGAPGGGEEGGDDGDDDRDDRDGSDDGDDGDDGGDDGGDDD